MKVIVFGATGTVGKKVVQQSLDAGHQVIAFCRDKSKLSGINHSSLRVIEGDVFSDLDVSKAIKEQEIVCVALGSGKNRKSVVRSQGTLNIIEAMKKHQVKRLICMSTLGAGDSQGNLNFFWKNIMFGWFLKDIFLDHELQEQYVRNSALDWTIVRPGAFTSGEKTGIYRHGFDGQDRTIKSQISRADVADFIIKQFASSTYLLKSPGLSY